VLDPKTPPNRFRARNSVLQGILLKEKEARMKAIETAREQADLSAREVEAKPLRMRKARRCLN
jgi:hypothetical protein